MKLSGSSLVQPHAIPLSHLRVQCHTSSGKRNKVSSSCKVWPKSRANFDATGTFIPTSTILTAAHHLNHLLTRGSRGNHMVTLQEDSRIGNNADATTLLLLAGEQHTGTEQHRELPSSIDHSRSYSLMNTGILGYVCAVELPIQGRGVQKKTLRETQLSKTATSMIFRAHFGPTTL